MCIYTWILKKKPQEDSIIFYFSNIIYQSAQIWYRLSGAEEVLGLLSAQEEADTRLLLHTAHASAEWHKTVVIISDDTVL